MDKIVKILLNWKVFLPLITLLAMAVWVAPAMLRKVRPYRPPAERDLLGWGTMGEAAAARLQSALDAEVSRQGVPGLQVSIQAADGLTWYGVSGTTDPERNIPLRRDHIIRAGSMTKTFTSVIILQLVDDGKLSLDDPLSKWYPDFPNAKNTTLRQMLSHRSGIFEILENPAARFSLFFPSKAWQTQELVSIAAQEKPRAQNEYYYSNTNFILLGLIAEQVTGQDMLALYRQNIFDPLGLKSTYFVPYESAPQMLIGGYDRDMIPLPGLFELNPSAVSAATLAHASGAAASTADDLRKFYDGLFSGQLISASALKEMTAFFPATDSAIPQVTGYGLGLFRLDVEGEEVWASLGYFIGSTTMVTYSPGKHDIVAIIGNLSLYDYAGIWKSLTGIYRVSSQ